MILQLTQYSDLALLILRLTVAIIFVYHALPKLKNSQGMASGMGWPVGAVLALGAVELLTAIGLVLGFYIQVAALLLSVIMLGAILMKIVRWKVPFAAMDKTGWEFDLILLAANIVILVTGGGAK